MSLVWSTGRLERVWSTGVPAPSYPDRLTNLTYSDRVRDTKYFHLSGILCSRTHDRKAQLATHLGLPLHVDVSSLHNVVPSFSLCRNHRTAHTHASHTVALCVYHANPYCAVICSLCVLGNTFSLALCHMLAAARGAPGSCDQYSTPMYKSLQISPGRLLNLPIALR